MAWVKLDDHFPEHPKLLGLGHKLPICGWLQICAIAYCNRHLTDGLFPTAALVSFLPFSEHVQWTNWDAEDHPVTIDVFLLADDMVRAGIWDGPFDGVYRIHDYLEYQPSKADTKALREARAAAGRAGGQANAKQNGSKGEAKLYPVPDPVPDPSLVSNNKLATDVGVSTTGEASASFSLSEQNARTRRAMADTIRRPYDKKTR